MTLEEWMSYAHFYRGQLINEFTILEIAIEYYLAEHFTDSSDKQDELRSIIFNRMTFESKRTSFKTILEQKAISKGFVKNKSNSFPKQKLLEEIRRLNDNRNHFAHYTLVANDKFIDNGYVIGLAEFRDSTKYKWYTKEEFKSIIERIRNATNEVLTLKNE